MLTDKELCDIMERLRKGWVIRRDEIERLVSMAMTLNCRNAEMTAKQADPSLYPSHAPPPPTAQPYPWNTRSP